MWYAFIPNEGFYADETMVHQQVALPTSLRCYTRLFRAWSCLFVKQKQWPTCFSSRHRLLWQLSHHHHADVGQEADTLALEH